MVTSCLLQQVQIFRTVYAAIFVFEEGVNCDTMNQKRAADSTPLLQLCHLTTPGVSSPVLTVALRRHASAAGGAADRPARVTGRALLCDLSLVSGAERCHRCHSIDVITARDRRGLPVMDVTTNQDIRHRYGQGMSVDLLTTYVDKFTLRM